MTEYITSGIYATSFFTYTRRGNTYYKMNGWQLGKKVYRRSATDFDGASRNPLETIGWANYISETAYNRLSTVMKESFDASGHKIAPYSALVEIPQGEGYFKLGLISDMVYSPELYPCEGIVCDPECVNDDLYSQVCDEGICIRGTIIEADSVACGYVPPHEEPPEDEDEVKPPFLNAENIVLIILAIIIFYILAKSS